MRCIGLLLLVGHLVSAQPDQPTLRQQVDALPDKKFSENDVTVANGLLPMVESTGDSKLISDLFDWLSDYYTKIGDYEHALVLCRKMAEAADRTGDDLLVAESKLNFGNVYLRTGQYELAKNTFLELERTYNSMGDTLRASRVASNIGSYYFLTDNLDSALHRFLLAKETVKTHGTAADRLIISKNLGAIYSKMGMAERSLPYNQEVLYTILSGRDTFSFASAYSNLAYTLHKIGDFERAFTLYDSSLYYSRLLDQDAVTYVTLKDISDDYLLMGDYENALIQLRDYHAVRDSVLGEKTLNRLAELEVEYETEQRQLALKASEEKIILLEREARWRNQRLIMIIIGLCLSLLAAVLIYRQWKKEIHHRATQEQLITSELANERLTSALLSNRLENKQEDLTDFALDIERKNRFSRELTDRLIKLRAYLPGQLRSQVDDLIHFTNGHDQLNEHLEVVQENVDQVNHEFRQKLKSAFPNLTSNDRSLAGLLRLNMTNKEIAASRGISTASAKMARYRLRKKLSLNPADDINTFLREL